MSPDTARVNNASDQDAASAARFAVPVSRSVPYDWGAEFSARYAAHASESAEDRAIRAAKSRVQRTKNAKPITPEQEAILDMVHARRASMNALVERRLKVGFEWRGGTFAGSGIYRREPFIASGLPSENEPILKLFVTKLRRTRNLKVGDDKAVVTISDSKLLALDAAYVHDNDVCCGVLRVEVDRVLTWSAIIAACDAHGVPLPNIVVGWCDAVGDVHRPHLLWLLDDSVPLKNRRRASSRVKDLSRFRGLYRGVLRGLVHALADLGADPGGLMNSHRHKNPLCPLWSHRIMAQVPYALRELAETVDTRVRMVDLVRKPASHMDDDVLEADHPDPEIALGSNRLFSALAAWARREVSAAKSVGSREEEFSLRVADEACRLAVQLVGAGNGAMAEEAAMRMAERVSKWTWHTYKTPKPRIRKTEVEASAGRANHARRVNEVRTDRTEHIIVQAALAVADVGERITRVAVLNRITGCGIKSERTVRRYWGAVREALENRTSRGASVKKENSASAGAGKLAEVILLDPQTSPDAVVPAFGPEVSYPPIEVTLLNPSVTRPTSARFPVSRPPRPKTPAFLLRGYQGASFAVVPAFVASNARPSGSVSAVNGEEMRVPPA